MSRDVGSYSEVKSCIKELESREAGNSEMGPTGSLKTPYTAGKVHPSGKDFPKPSMGSMRKHLE